MLTVPAQLPKLQNQKSLKNRNASTLLRSHEKRESLFSMKQFAVSETHADHILNSLRHESELSIISGENIEHSYTQKEN